MKLPLCFHFSFPGVSNHFIFHFPMQSINLIDNQLVKSFVVQIWFRKNGYHLSLNRTEFESESTNANIGKNLQTVKESGQALSER